MSREDTFKLWESFKDSIIYSNRFFPENEELSNILDNLLKKTTYDPKDSEDRNPELKKDTQFYRARLGEHKKEENMRNPDPKIFPNNDGRCNPRGISYFYVAKDEETAIHEIRPEVNETVTIAAFENIKKLKICNFALIYSLEKSLFGRECLSESEFTLLEIIVNELSKPINSKETLQYIPIQYIVEYLKHASFDGFTYISSLTQGMNYVFFDSTMFKFIDNSIKYFTIEGINVSFERDREDNNRI